MILVVGATGRRGSSREKMQALAAAGAETLAADLKDAASLREACAGAAAVITTASSTFSRQDGRAIRRDTRRCGSPAAGSSCSMPTTR